MGKLTTAFWVRACVLTGSLLLLSCGGAEEPVPSNILPAEKMVEVMFDVHLVEGARNGNVILGDTNSLEDFYHTVYTKHGISEEVFKESFFYYSAHQKAFIPIYEKVLDSLQANDKLLEKPKPH